LLRSVRSERCDYEMSLHTSTNTLRAALCSPEYRQPDGSQGASLRTVAATKLKTYSLEKCGRSNRCVARCSVLVSTSLNIVLSHRTEVLYASTKKREVDLNEEIILKWTSEV
jgi:hypothetical protein